MSSPIAGASKADYVPPRFNIVGRVDDYQLGASANAVPDRRFNEAKKATPGGAYPDGASARAVRLDIGQISRSGSHPMLQSLANSRSINNLVLSDSSASSRSGSPSASPPVSARGGGGSGAGSASDNDDSIIADKLASVLSHAERINRLELDLRQSNPPWSVRLPEILGSLDRKLADLSLTIPALTAEGAEALSEILANPFTKLTRLSVTTSPSFPLSSDVVLGVCEGLRSNTVLREISLQPVKQEEVDAAVSAARDAIRTGGAHTHSSQARGGRVAMPGAAEGAGMQVEQPISSGTLHLTSPKAVRVVINGQEHMF